MSKKGPSNILLVEDEPIIALRESRQLEKAGYKVLQSSNGEKAIAVVNMKNPVIDLILMDINLGKGMDGSQTAKEILKNHNIPLLFLSSYSESEVVQKIESIASYGYVAKQSGIAVLDASIKMAYKLHENFISRKCENKSEEYEYSLVLEAFDKIDYPVFVINTDFQIIVSNRAAKRQYSLKNGLPLYCSEVLHKITSYIDCKMKTDEFPGISYEENIGSNLAETGSLMDKVSYILKQFDETLKTGKLHNFDYDIETRTGKNTYTVSIVPFSKDKIFVTVVNITIQKQAEENISSCLVEREVLLREIHHRVKNNMQVIISLLRLHSRKIKDKHLLRVFDDCRDRVNAMSLIHEALYKSENLGRIEFYSYLRNLCLNMNQVYSTSNKNIVVKVEPCKIILGIDQGIAVGTIVSELLGNAYKHAFFEREKGTVAIRMSIDNEEQVELIIQDDGIGLPEEINFRQPKSLGFKLAASTVTRDLEGSFEVERNHGTKFIICFKANGY